MVKENIARIAKRCPENITSFVKCVKLTFPKVLRKFFKKVAWIFCGEIVWYFSLLSLLSLLYLFFSSLITFGKSNLTTNVMFSGQRFAILTMFWRKKWKVYGQKIKTWYHVTSWIILGSPNYWKWILYLFDFFSFNLQCNLMSEQKAHIIWRSFLHILVVWTRSS